MKDYTGKFCNHNWTAGGQTRKARWREVEREAIKIFMNCIAETLCGHVFAVPLIACGYFSSSARFPGGALIVVVGAVAGPAGIGCVADCVVAAPSRTVGKITGWSFTTINTSCNSSVGFVVKPCFNPDAGAALGLASPLFMAISIGLAGLSPGAPGGVASALFIFCRSFDAKGAGAGIAGLATYGRDVDSLAKGCSIAIGPNFFSSVPNDSNFDLSAGAGAVVASAKPSTARATRGSTRRSAH